MQNYWIPMIIKGIPFRIWEKVIRFGTGFFFITAIISPFLALILYIFEADFEYLFVKTQSDHNTKQNITNYANDAGLIDPLLDENHTPYIPIPDIEKNISFIHYNYRPDNPKNANRLISLATKNSSLIAKEQELIYLDCKDINNIQFTKDVTPYSITPISIQDNKILLNFEVSYKTKEGVILFQNTEKIELKKIPQQATKLSSAAISAKRSLENTNYFSSDKLISLLGGEEYKKEKNLSRIYFKENKKNPVLFIKKGDLLCYENNNWEKKEDSTEGKPLLLINSVNNKELTCTYWNESGFFQKRISINKQIENNSIINNFSFEKLYKRNNESVICKIKGKTFILKPNDWLIKNKLSWNHLLNIDDLQNLIALKNTGEIIIFDCIKHVKGKEIFIGYIFDETRSNYKKLEILLKKKETYSYNS